VAGIYARGVVAGMTHCATVRDITSGEQKKDTVGTLFLPVELELNIAV